MNNLRVELNNENELEDILNKLKLGFKIEKVSKLYKKRDKSGYYVYLEVDKKEKTIGRSKRFNKEEEKYIKMEYFQGKSLRNIAKEFKCSTTLIFNIVNKK